MQINIEKRHLVIFGLIIAGLIVIVSGIFVYAAWDTNKKVYHSADDVKVNVGGVDYSLQEAINQGKIGGSAGGFNISGPYSVDCPRNGHCGIKSVNMNSHKVCFLTQVILYSHMDDDEIQACYISGSILYGQDNFEGYHCEAMCLD